MNRINLKSPVDVVVNNGTIRSGYSLFITKDNRCLGNHKVFVRLSYGTKKFFPISRVTFNSELK